MAITPTFKKPIPSKPNEIDITAGKALQWAKETRTKLFQKEKEKVYVHILNAVNKGDYEITYKFNGNVNREDIQSLQQELIDKGFRAVAKWGLFDKLEISWYPKD